MSADAQLAAPLAPTFRLDGRTALVTGAGRGLGRAIAVALAESGADVGVLSRTGAELEAVRAMVRSLGRESWAVPCDVADPPAVERAVAAMPQVDLLVAVAGINVPQPFLDVEVASFDRMTGVNLRGLFFTTQAVVRRMVADGSGGSVVLMSSQMGHVGAPDRSVYCATKHAVEGLTKALAVELAPYGIRVNAVAPTYVRTPLTEPFLADGEFRAAAEAAIPLGRVGDVRDVVGAVTYLSSPAAGLVTGTSLVVDGGYTAQ